MTFLIVMLIVVLAAIAAKKDQQQGISQNNTGDAKEKDDNIPDWMKEANTVLFTDDSFGF